MLVQEGLRYVDAGTERLEVCGCRKARGVWVLLWEDLRYVGTGRLEVCG